MATGTAHKVNKAVAQIAPQSVAAAASAQSANSIDVTPFAELLCIFNVGAYTGGVTSVKCEIIDSADGTSFAAVTGGDSGVTLTAASKVYVGRVRRGKLRQYAAIKMTVNGGTSAIIGGTLIGCEARMEPVSQDNTVAFNLE